MKKTIDDSLNATLKKENDLLVKMSLAIGKQLGYLYTGGDFMDYARINPRAAQWLNCAEAALNAIRDDIEVK